MKPCRACSYTPPVEPKVFCPSCGAMWHEAAPPKSDHTVKGESRPKKPGATKTRLVITEVAVKKNEPKATTVTAGKQKRNPTKKG